VAAREGLQAKSFKKAAESYSDATGGSMSSASLRRITEGFGQQLEDKRVNEAQQVYAAKAPQSAQQVVRVATPIKEQANISTDGGMVLLREEGWKELKMSVFSEVQVKVVKPSPAEAHPEPRITLRRHKLPSRIADCRPNGATSVFGRSAAASGMLRVARLCE